MVIESNQSISEKCGYKASSQIDSGSLRAFLGVTNTIALGETTRSEKALQSLKQLSVRLRCDSAEDVLQRSDRPHELKVSVIELPRLITVAYRLIDYLMHRSLTTA